MDKLRYRTKDKLDEAEFFLNLVRENGGKLKKFNYYSSAFISAARSVPWVMKSEYGGIPSWGNWYSKKGINLNNDEKELLKSTNTFRIETVKKGVHPRVFIVINGTDINPNDLINKDIRISGTENSPIVEIIDNGESTIIEPESVEIVRKSDQFSDKDIIQIFDQYYKSLKELVDECVCAYDKN